MSALVAYGSSEEDSDCSEDETPTPSAGQKSTGLVLPAPKTEAKPPVSGISSMFASLPPPKKESSPVLTEENDADIAVPVKSIKPEIPPAKQRVKITIPSLLDFKDDEDSAPRAKKVKPTPKGSGLLAILPEPKNIRSNRPMLPYVLTKRPVPKPAPPKRPAVTKTEAPLVTSHPDSDEDSGDGDFFSLSSHVPAEPAEINLEDLLPPTLGPSAKPRKETVAIAEPRVEATWEEAGSSSSSSWQPPQEDSIEPPNADLQLDEAALLKLCGRRSKRSKEDLKLIELHGNNMLPDPKDWMLKQMTEEQEMHGHRSSQPSSAHRRKHQITYLAFQAKEREIELKNQWSQNRQTKKQTQAKYGF